MFVSNEQRVVQGINGGVQIRLRMPEFPKDGAAVHAMKHMIVVVGLVGEPSVIQEHVKQRLAAFRLWCNSDRGVIWRKLCARVTGRYPTARCPAIVGVTCG